LDKSAKGHRPSRESADYISLTWTNIFQCIYININRRLSCDYYILAQIKFFANGFFISTFFGNFVVIIKTFVYIMTVFGVFCRILSCLSTTVCVEQDDISHLKLKVSLFFRFSMSFHQSLFATLHCHAQIFRISRAYTKIHDLCTIFAFFFDFEGILGLFSLYCTLFVFSIKPQIHLSCIMR